MKRDANIFRKITKQLLIFLFINTLLFIPPQAKAMFVDFNAASNAKEAISGLGVNMGSLNKFIQAFNVSDKKNQHPQVALNFNPVNPVPGQKVTAVATPKYFMNDDDDLYFTWYLKIDRCPEKCEKGSHNCSYKEECDLNDDNEIDIEDHKIRAMRIIANNDFEWNKSGAYDTHTDHDGYNSIWGGDDQKGKNNYCYVHDVQSGNEQKIDCDEHLFPNAPDEETGDTVFNREEEEFWHTNPNDDDTADTGNGDEANITGLGVSSFTWTYAKGDEVGVVIEGISNEPTRTYDSSYMIMWAMPNNKCDTEYEYFEGTEVDTDTVTYEFGDYIPDDGELPANLPEDVINYIHGLVDSYADTDGESVEVTIETTTVTSFNEAKTKATIKTTYVVSYIAYDVNGEERKTKKPKKFPPTTETKDISDKVIKKVSDLNECLYSNLIDPLEGGGRAQKLNLNLSYTPEFPINDTKEDSDDGEILNVNSTVLNAENPDYLRYKWEVFASDVPNPDSWGEAISKQYLPEATQTIGLGLTNFSFRLNLTDDALSDRVDDIDNFYLKVKLTVTEGVPQGITEDEIETSVKREGHADVVIPISSTTQKIQVFNTEAEEASGEVKLSVGSTERCTSETEQTLCSVIKNDIISLQVEGDNLSDFLWTVNGEPLKPFSPNCISGECNESDLSNTNITYFPVLEEKGFRYNVKFSAMNLNTGEKVNLTRIFEVTEPSIKIMSEDETICQPVLLGSYVDLDGNEWPDYSTTNFVALAIDPNTDEGSTIKLRSVFNGFVPEEDYYSWYVNGEEITPDNAYLFGYTIEDNIITLPSKEWKDFYTIQLDALYTQDNLIKKALYTYWKVPYSQFYEKSLSASVEVKFTDFIDTQTGVISQKNKSQEKILASLMSSTPAYLAFLFRIVITAFLLLISSRAILSLFPNIRENH